MRHACIVVVLRCAHARTRPAGGWFHTGDQGFLDEVGYLTLTGRIKELINRGGEKISPIEARCWHAVYSAFAWLSFVCLCREPTCAVAPYSSCVGYNPCTCPASLHSDRDTLFSDVVPQWLLGTAA